MRCRNVFALLLAIVLPAGSAVQATELAAAAEDNVLKVMTFNVRFAAPMGKHAWPLRRPIMRDLIERHAPDVIGTQEGLYQQLKDLEVDLPEYRWIGTGRDGGSRGEFMAIFYRHERLEPLEFDHFWLSDTPDVIASTTWGNTNRRMATWVRFRDRRSDQVFYVMNTHFDHQIQPAREKSAALLLDRVARLNQDVPILLIGDFNAVAGRNKVYSLLVEEGPFDDVWQMARERSEVSGTFHGFAGVVDQMPRIDWILLRGSAEVLRAEVITDADDGSYPSDHFPVMATLRLVARP
jgi:endonuclease/exonuclease/phosphatase family metal-dependent hydrolase